MKFSQNSEQERNFKVSIKPLNTSDFELDPIYIHVSKPFSMVVFEKQQQQHHTWSSILLAGHLSYKNIPKINYAFLLLLSISCHN